MTQPGPSASSTSKTTPVTSSIVRTLASTSITQADLESPDPLSLSGPSPSKKAKHVNGQASPTRADSGSSLKIKLKLNGDTNGDSRASSTSNVHAGPKRKLIPEVVLPIQSRLAKHAAPARQAQESDGEEDAIDWGDSMGHDADGDWHMNESSFRSPSPGKAPVMAGSGRTGERDQRSEQPRHSVESIRELTHVTATFQKLNTLFEDILEEFDALPADVSIDDLRAGRYFATVSNIGSIPLLSPRAINKITEYASRVKGKKKRDGEVWDADVLVKVLRMLEKSMREGSDLASVDEIKKAEPPAKTKKGKKSSKSPELPNEDGLQPVEGSFSPEQSARYDQDTGKLAAAGAAAFCTLTLLDQEGLSKQVGCYPNEPPT